MRVTTTFFLTLFAPAVLGAQQIQAGAGAATAVDASAATSAVSARASGDAAADVRIERALARAEAEGLATAGLENRARMGAARGVAATRIAAALETRVDAMLSARRALRASGAANSETMVELGADAIQSGARATQVADVAAEFTGNARSRALATLVDLAADGRIGADVVASVRSALEAGGSARDAAGAAGSIGAAATVSGGAAAGAVGSATDVTGSVDAVVGGTLRGTRPR